MSWCYVIKTGRLYDPNGTFLGVGYSGNSTGLNNPAMQNVVGVGPIPVGLYRIGPSHRPVDHLGPLAMPLVPEKGNNMHGRSAFFAHGDNPKLDHTASNGCIILSRPFRQTINDSSDKLLRVVAEEVDKGTKPNGPNTRLSGAAAAVPSLPTGNGSAATARVTAAADRVPELVDWSAYNGF